MSELLKKENAPTALALVALYTLFLYLCYHFNVLQDDAFITLRYAENYLHGHGLVWNIGERVEGYTNFLWLLLLILGKQIGIEYLVSVKWLGALCSLGTITLTYFFVRDLLPKESKALGSICAGALVAGNYSLAYWSMSGLETALFVFLSVAAFYLYHKKSYLLAPALTLALLTRPEGALLIGFIVLVGVIRARGVPRFEALVALIALIPIVPYAVFKLAYFGDLAPNPFYAKTVWDVQQLQAGLEYWWEFSSWYFGAGLAAIFVGVFAQKADRSSRWLLWFFVLYSIYIALVGGDVLKAGRFGLPLVAPFAIALAASLPIVVKKRTIYAAVFTALLGAQLYLPYDDIKRANELENGLIIQVNETVSQLKQVDRTDFTVAASTIGLAGYLLAGQRVIDMVGLTDTTIARHPQEPIDGLETTWRERKYNAEYALSEAPDYFLFGAGSKPSSPGERALFLYPTFLDNYRTVAFYSPSSDNTIEVYKRRAESLGKIERTIPATFVNHLHDGLSLVGQREHRAALDEFTSARKVLEAQGIEYPYLYYYAGLCLGEVGEDQAGMQAIMRALSLDPDLYGAHASIYLTFYPIEEVRDIALQSRKQLLRLTPWDVPRLDRIVGYQAGYGM